MVYLRVVKLQEIRKKVCVQKIMVIKVLQSLLKTKEIQLILLKNEMGSGKMTLFSFPSSHESFELEL